MNEEDIPELFTVLKKSPFILSLNHGDGFQLLGSIYDDRAAIKLLYLVCKAWPDGSGNIMPLSSRIIKIIEAATTKDYLLVVVSGKTRGKYGVATNMDDATIKTMVHSTKTYLDVIAH